MGSSPTQGAMVKRIVYIAHPIGGAVKENLEDLARILKEINLTNEDVIPVAPYFGDCVAMDDSDALQRKRGIENCIAMIETGIFDELWLTGKYISNGMNEEMKAFRLQGKCIFNYIGKM
jgi:hypothetical protein